MTIEELRQKAKQLPLLPGVYLMKDKDGYVIYVGKSKHLKNRVSSYFGSLKHVQPKVKRMVAAIDTFEYQLTDTELDALLLECELIKKYKPLYNRLLKNDKKYRYIHVDSDNELGSITAVYEKENTGLYFGPYDQRSNLLVAVEALRHYFQLPSCKQGIGTQACLAYRLKRCVGPCESVNKEKHQSALKELVLFLEGKNKQPILFYESVMQQASDNLDFDKAIIYRKNWQALKTLNYRHEAIKLSLEQTRAMAVLTCPTGGCKLYLLKGTTILQSFYLKDVDDKQLLEYFIEKGTMYLCEPFKKSQVFDKKRVDQSLILFSYFMNQHKETYYRIDNKNTIEKVCKQLIKAYKNQLEK